MKTLQKESSPFKLQDSSISRVEIQDAVSRSLLMSSATMGQSLLRVIKNSAGLSAATFNFPEYHNILTNPLTYPQFDAKDWIESLVQRGCILPNIGSRDISFPKLGFVSDEESDFSGYHLNSFTKQSFERIGRSDVSLNVYDSISHLREKYIFDTGVSSFLIKNDKLIQFLKNAYVELITRLPKSTYSLEVKLDPEVENWVTLFLYITPQEATDSFESEVQNFVFEWMFKQVGDIRKIVTIVDRVI